MKKKLILLLAAVYMLSLSGCGKKPNEIIDEQIPIMTVQEETEADIPEISVPSEKIETAGIPPIISAPVYEETYEGLLQRVYDELYTYVDEIRAAKESDGYLPVYDTSLELAESVLDGKTRSFEFPPAAYNIKGLVLFQGVTDLVRLFEDYPEQAKEEQDLIGFFSQYLSVYQNVAQGSAEPFLRNDVLYDLLFPNTNKTVTKEQGSDVVIRYDGYHGKIIYSERADTISFLWDQAPVCEDAVRLSGFSGTVSLAPVNSFGAVGRTTQIRVQSGNAGPMKNLLINGDMVLIDPDFSSEEYLAAANNRKTRTQEEHWLDLIENTEQLEVLQISHCEMDDADALSLLEKIPDENINTLNLSDNLLTELDLSGFARLDSLDLSGNPALSSIKMPEKDTIITVYLRDTSLPDLTMLSAYKKIGSLDIRNTRVPDLTGLAGKTVSSLDFNADITDYHGLSEIAGLRSLYIVSEKELPTELWELVKGLPAMTEFYYNDQAVALQ